VIGPDRPNDAIVEMIVAASSTTVRRTLVALTERANFEVVAVAEDPATLTNLLERDRGASVVTGGTLSGTRHLVEPLRQLVLATGGQRYRESGSAECACSTQSNSGSRAHHDGM
jgi:hypothetical protein